MARLIFISPYLKGGEDAARLSHRTRYVATREGVERLKSEDRNLSPTKKQEEFIVRLLRSFPEAKKSFEYEDYKAAPTRKNAEELIEHVREQYVASLGQRENFLDYVAHRPGVKSDGDHGLWNQDGKVPVLSKTVEEVAHHDGNVWTPVLSIRREDAERLGYTNAENWRALVNSVRSELAEGYKIKPDHLRWYAALHEKPNNYHIHMVIFSTDPKEGYLTKQGIRRIKAAFAKHIFQQDMINTYEKKTVYRDTLQRSAEERMQELIRQMEQGALQDDNLEGLMTVLAARLRNVGGKKVYGYLPPQIKRIVDEIVDKLAEDERVASAYSLWQDMQDEVCRVYSDELPERLPLSRQKEFKPVRNMVVREALRLSEQKVTIEDDDMDEEPDEEVPEESSERAPEEKRRTWEDTSAPTPKVKARSVYEQAERYQRAKRALYEETADADEKGAAVTALEKLWNEGYEMAGYLLGKAYRDGLGAVPDIRRAESWFLQCAEKNNPYAQYALGKLLLEQKRTADGLVWLGWAADQGDQHAQYRLGKLYLTGDGTERNTDKAIDYLKSAARAKNQYAQYALGKLYLLGIDVARDEAQAISYLRESAAQGNVYAQHLLDHKEDRQAASIGMSVIRLLHNVGKIFRETTVRDATYKGMQIDRKRRKQLQEKRLAMGHKPDDHEENTQQQM